MISEKELLELIADMESDRVERTESVNDTDKFSRAICAFANDMPNHRKPGYLLVGVKDDGTLSGLTVSDQLLINLAAIRSNGQVLPQPAMSVAKFSLDGGDVAVVEVHPADMPPVRYRGIVRIRVGPRRADANEQEERMLSERRIAGVRNFDGQACQGASISDLSLVQFNAYRQQAVSADVIAQNKRSVEDQLAGLRFLDPTTRTPTNAAVLLFGKDPLYYFPGAYVQYLEFEGTGFGDRPIDDDRITGDLVTVLAKLDARIALIARKRPELMPDSAVRERMVYNVPDQALRELVMNAVAHRDYQSNSPIRLYCFADRVEIQSPGGLFGEVTPTNFGSAVGYRNPTLAEAMIALGYVNRYGYGIGRVKELLAQNGNPPAEFVLDQPYFQATVRFRS